MPALQQLYVYRKKGYQLRNLSTRGVSDDDGAHTTALFHGRVRASRVSECRVRLWQAFSCCACEQ